MVSFEEVITVSANQTSSPPVLAPDAVQQAFLAVLPRIALHARIQFRNLRCPHHKEDAVSEAVALAWCWFARLVRRGKDPLDFISILATYASSHVRAGRRLCGQERARDVLSPVAQARHGFAVAPLPNGSSMCGNVFDESLADNTQTPPEEQAAFRLDFPRWRLRQCERNRLVLDDLMLGERPLDVARRHNLSPSRISQMRREFHDDWMSFCGEQSQPHDRTAAV
jgi:hypothetical protein